MRASDLAWIGKALYSAKNQLSPVLHNWYYPPMPPMTLSSAGSPPSAESFHLRRLFLWAPRKMWNINFKCCHCPCVSLTSKGLYSHVRLVVDLKDSYYLASEYWEYRSCKGTFIGWDQRMVDMVPEGTREIFPAVLTRKYACDRAVVGLMKARTLGNSSTALRNNLLEQHSDEWLRQELLYLSCCQRHKRGLVGQQEYAKSDPFPPFPRAPWFLAVYVRDVWRRLPTLLAAASSTFGRILKIASTKKVH